jgi:hypothetical protein
VDNSFGGMLNLRVALVAMIYKCYNTKCRICVCKVHSYNVNQVRPLVGVYMLLTDLFLVLETAFAQFHTYVARELYVLYSLESFFPTHRYRYSYKCEATDDIVSPTMLQSMDCWLMSFPLLGGFFFKS